MQANFAIMIVGAHTLSGTRRNLARAIYSCRLGIRHPYCSLIVPVDIPLAVAAVLYRLQEMVFADVLRSLQVGDGAGHLEDRVEGPGREVELLGGIPKCTPAVGLQATEPVDQPRRNVGVAGEGKVFVEIEGGFKAGEWYDPPIEG